VALRTRCPAVRVRLSGRTGVIAGADPYLHGCRGVGVVRSVPAMTALTVPTTGVSLARVAGVLTIIGAATGIVGALVLILVPPAVPPGTLSHPLGVAGHAVAQTSFFLNHVALGVGLVALGLSSVSSARPGRIGTWIAVAGLALLSVCELWAIALAEAPFPSPETAPLDTAYGLSSITIGVGLVIAGIGVARTREWTGWRRWIVLVMGAMLFLVVVPGLMMGFVGGRIVLALWMVAWALFGVALLGQRERR